MKSTISLNMDGYLVQFVSSFMDDGHQLRKESWLGGLLYDCLAPVPENCHYIPPCDAKKKRLNLSMETLGGRNQARKNTFYHYYLPRSKQIMIERYVKDFFDNIFFLYLDSYPLEEVDIKVRIERFCQMYGIDFGHYYDTLKKKYYRYRQEKQ